MSDGSKRMANGEWRMAEARPKLAIITESLRRDNHAPLRFFRNIDVTHFYQRAPYQDMAKDEFAGAVQYRGLFDLYNKLIVLKPDLIQGSEPYASKKSLLLAKTTLLAAWRLCVPFVFPTLENLPPRQRFGAIVGWAVERFFAFYARRARAIIALNNGAAANLRSVGIPDSKIVRFPWGVWGVDRTIFKHAKKIPHHAFKNPSVLFAGRMDPEKGVRDILDAFAALARVHPDWQLVMIGKGMLEEEVKTFVRANRLTDRVHILGLIPSRELPPYYSAASVTVYPSVATQRNDEAGIKGWSEQVGTVILQSLACGTPVVATRSGSIPEYLPQDCGLLVPEHEPEELAGAIKRLMTDDGLRRRFSRQAVEYIAENFDAKKNIEQAEKMALEWLTTNI